jgi:hypothetical protein
MRTLEELGYEDEGGREFHNKDLQKNIYFDNDRTVSCFSYHSSIPFHRPESFTIQELQAINIELEKYGWLEENESPEIENMKEVTNKFFDKYTKE